jgi:hypothetical protein
MNKLMGTKLGHPAEDGAFEFRGIEGTRRKAD